MKIKLITIVGARPQFIKAAAVSRTIARLFSGQIEEKIIHTGQHYDPEMSAVFFDELQIPRPYKHLNIGSANHGAQTGQMLQAIENVLVEEKPDLVLVFGDTNSTLAGALAASKIHIPVAHVEAGLRSHNKAMPEEINRILTDHVSSLLFPPTMTGLENLNLEGFLQNEAEKADRNHPALVLSGDVMYDNALFYKEIADGLTSDWFSSMGLVKGEFFLSTIHRNANTDDKEKLKSIFTGLYQIAEKHGIPVVLPLHPRTKKMLGQFAEEDSFFAELQEDKIRIIPPASFLQMIALESSCRLILTDSGGVQKEAYFYRKPCVVLRPETEWVELVENGFALLADYQTDRIVKSVDSLLSKTINWEINLYGKGDASEVICTSILQFLKRNLQP